MEEIREAYPRPQFERKDWMSLNGAWDFRFDEEEWREIRVPFAYQAPLSGIGSNRICDRVCYRRRFRVPERWRGRDIRLHFGAVDYQCRALVNGRRVGEHTGGNIGFSFDITEALTWEEEEITVLVWDPWDDEGIPRGKQYWKKEPESIWYTRTTGIWQTVWLEPVSRLHLESLRVRGQVDSGRVEIAWRVSGAPAGSRISFDISLRGEKIASLSQEITEKKGSLGTDLFNAHIFRMNFHGDGWCWTPEHPTLFDLEVRVEEGQEIRDEVRSYFGIREIEAKDGIVYLNHRPYYQKLVLDQGYWPEGIMTAPSDESLPEDIEKAKAMGFNGCRKHQKAEDPRFLYWADRLGYLVWSEIGSCITFSEESAGRLLTEWREAVTRDMGHPSIVAWVTVNESWGVPGVARDRQQQDLTRALYYQCKALDPTRLVIGNDGWEIAISDLCAIHNYRHGAPGDRETREAFRRSLSTREALLEGMPSDRPILIGEGDREGMPILLTEFGGITLETRRDQDWGYTRVRDAEGLEEEYRSLLEAIGASRALCGFCYTQLCDVEQETNGLLTAEREFKADPEKIRQINDRVKGFWRQ